MRYQPHHTILTLMALILTLDVTVSTARSLDETANAGVNPGAPTHSNTLVDRGGELQGAQQLREFFTGDLPSMGAVGEREALKTFYEQRSYDPFWTHEGQPNAKAQQAARYLSGVAADGLEPADYPVPRFSDLSKLPEDEVRMGLSVIAFARHARGGRVAFNRVNDAISYNPDVPDPERVLAGIEAATDVRLELEFYLPAHEGYRALKAKVAELRRGGSSTSHSGLLDTVIANMDRWRWMPRDLGRTRVEVNIPDYSMKVIADDRVIWTTRVIVGKPGEMATPLLSSTLQYITINPTWNVPPSLIRKEYLPALKADPSALRRLGLVMSRGSDGSLQMHQPPGPRNALGKLRFSFSNKFSVYQHDTPNKALFAQPARAYSHGCIRVKDPDKYAEALLSFSQPQENHTAERIRSLYGDEETHIKIKAPIQVHLTYQTAFVDAAGEVQQRADIYGWDKDHLTLLRGGELVAAKAPPTGTGTAAKPQRAVAEASPKPTSQASALGRRSASGGRSADRHFRTYSYSNLTADAEARRPDSF